MSRMREENEKRFDFEMKETQKNAMITNVLLTTTVFFCACIQFSVAADVRRLFCNKTQFMGCTREDECLCMPIPKLSCHVNAQCGDTLFEETCRLSDPRNDAKCIDQKCQCVEATLSTENRNPDPVVKAFAVIKETLEQTAAVTEECRLNYLSHAVRMPADLLVAISRDPMLHYDLLCEKYGDEKPEILITNPKTRTVIDSFRIESHRDEDDRKSPKKTKTTKRRRTKASGGGRGGGSNNGGDTKAAEKEKETAETVRMSEL